LIYVVACQDRSLCPFINKEKKIRENIWSQVAPRPPAARASRTAMTSSTDRTVGIRSLARWVTVVVRVNHSIDVQRTDVANVDVQALEQLLGLGPRRTRTGGVDDNHLPLTRWIDDGARVARRVVELREHHVEHLHPMRVLLMLLPSALMRVLVGVLACHWRRCVQRGEREGGVLGPCLGNAAPHQPNPCDSDAVGGIVCDGCIVRVHGSAGFQHELSVNVVGFGELRL